MAKIKLEKSSITPKSSDLCCSINPTFVCRFCKKKMCVDCGKAWSGRKHFILDVCRGRFSEAQLTESSVCFKKRIVKGKRPSTLGDCFVCKVRPFIPDYDREEIE